MRTPKIVQGPEPECPICTLDWPTDPEDPEYLEIRRINHEHLMALGSPAELLEHVKVRSMWFHGDAGRAEADARALLESWRTHRGPGPEHVEVPEQGELGDAGDDEAEISEDLQRLLERALDTYCGVQERLGRLPDPDILVGIEKNFRRAAAKASRIPAPLVESG